MSKSTRLPKPQAQTITYIQGDLFAGLQTIKGPVVIAHVVNDKGAWGSGFVVPLGQAYPAARQAYLAWTGKESLVPDCVKWHPPFERGHSQVVQVADKIYVANMMAQTLGGVRPLFYNDLVRAMEELPKMVPEKSFHIAAPLFGAGLAGGNWNFVEKLIEDCWLKAELPVTVFYLPQFLPDNWSPPFVNQGE